MALETFFIFLVAIIAFCLLVYTVYRRYSGMSKPTQYEKILESINNDPLFNQTLSPDQVKALHRLLSSV